MRSLFASNLGYILRIGALPLLGACAILVNVKEEIRQGKCLDLEANKPLVDNGAIGACEQILKSLKK